MFSRHIVNKVFKRFYTPRRAVLYVPGDDIRKVTKATGLNVDCIALDCEDGVAMNRKTEARELIRSFFNSETEIDVKKVKPRELSARINSVDSGLCQDDLQCILSGEKYPKTILLPKVESVNDVKFFADCLDKFLRCKNDPINLIFYVESCKSILGLAKVCEFMESNGKLFKAVGIVFGSDDFCASLGAQRDDENNSIEILYARQHCVLVAKAYNLQAIDMVHIEFKNLEALRQQSLFGAKLGYTGKQIIHPGQISIVQECFSPSAEKVEWAQALMKAFETHQVDGKGAFVFRNSMIDMPTMKQAQNILKINELTQ